MEGQEANIHPPQPKEVSKDVLIPRGEVILGTTNPRTLTKEEFHNSSDLLFHGAREKFSFSQEIDYTKTRGTYSDTLGRGFYTTPRRENADIYTRLRKGNHTVLEVLPYQARMLDVRATNHPTNNAPFPENLFNEYVSFLKNYINTSDTDFIKKMATDVNFRTRLNALQTHRDIIYALKRMEKPIDVRNITASEPGGTMGDVGADFFTEFMLQKGFDGLIAYEGGDSPEQTQEASVVFYNAKKVGDYEAWHPEEREETPVAA